MEDEGNFDALIADLELLTKAQPKTSEKEEDAAGDKKIAAAAADADGDGKADHAEPDGDEGNDGDGDGDGDELPLGKAFSVVIDGEEHEAYDGREALEALSKSLAIARDVGLEATKRTDVLAKALSGAGRLIKGLERQVTEQAELIKSLRTDLDRIGSQPAGRKAVLSVHEKPGATAAPDAPAPRELLAKALSAHRAGRITAIDVATVEASLARRLEIPPDLLARVTAA